jgi:hypothetical protein
MDQFRRPNFPTSKTGFSANSGLKLTYMEVRFLVDDLKLTPKDPEPPKPSAPPANSSKRTGGSPALGPNPFPLWAA